MIKSPTRFHVARKRNMAARYYEQLSRLPQLTLPVEREWAMAKAWIHQRLSTPQEPSAD